MAFHYTSIPYSEEKGFNYQRVNPGDTAILIGIFAPSAVSRMAFDHVIKLAGLAWIANNNPIDRNCIHN